MAEDLTNLVDTTIDAAIRSFHPGDESSYTHWDAELHRIELRLLETPSLPNRQHHLASIRARRIGLAFDVSKYDLVLDQSAQFMRDVTSSHPSFFGVAILRARCLHSAGAHQEEITEILDLAQQPEIQGGEYVSLLEHLAKKHPGSIPRDGRFSTKMQDAITVLRALGYETLPAVTGEMELEKLALQTASELRRVNRERGEALLATNS